MPGKGRPLGSKNQPTRALIRLLNEKFPGWNPIVQMAEVANDKEADTLTRFNAAREVSQYIAPKLRSVEMDITSAGESLADQSTQMLLDRVHELTGQKRTADNRLDS